MVSFCYGSVNGYIFDNHNFLQISVPQPQISKKYFKKPGSRMLRIMSNVNSFHSVVSVTSSAFSKNIGVSVTSELGDILVFRRVFYFIIKSTFFFYAYFCLQCRCLKNNCRLIIELLLFCRDLPV